MTIAFVPLTFATWEAVCLSVVGTEEDADGRALPVDPDEVLFGQAEWPTDDGPDGMPSPRAAPLALFLASAKGDDGAELPAGATQALAPHLTGLFVQACRMEAQKAGQRGYHYAYRVGLEGAGGSGEGVSLARAMASEGAAAWAALRSMPIAEALMYLHMASLNALERQGKTDD